MPASDYKKNKQQVHICTIRAQQNIRLDELLRVQLPSLIEKEISNSKIRRLIVAGAVKINAVQCRVPGADVRAGSIVSCAVDEEKLFYEKPADDILFEVTDESVLFEDDSIIVVNKPAFFPTEAGMVGSRDNLHAAVIRYLQKKNPALRNPPYVGVMHRLDHETSGVILFTKTRSVNAACHDMFEKHTAHKVYRAVVCAPDSAQQKNNVSAGTTFTVSMFMNRISPKSAAAKWGEVPQSKGGVESRTDFTIAGENLIAGIRVLFVECRPLTGRTHQIRIHLALRGMPILGDTLYGAKPFERIMLHAQSLTFPHPVTGQEMCVSSALPELFE
jgi:23S rRNA pseudouridine1911/1915/1917 synthase